MLSRTYQLMGADYPGNRAEDVKNLSLSWMIGFMFVASFLGLLSLVMLRKLEPEKEKKELSGTSAANYTFETIKIYPFIFKQVRCLGKYLSISFCWSCFNGSYCSRTFLWL
ncbi:unnamed protein product [Musa acuminata subsp. malaccensis]|uniref:(wild Malaysian banana) hypothetical protein n=1 Tax=Musa acuminata subsp. malaccensis TaxID=214687 RepID=A0A804JIZ6_MUSAM|nr:unnamed protein product [Musa acuminata subsp. malaccensis]